MTCHNASFLYNSAARNYMQEIWISWMHTSVLPTCGTSYFVWSLVTLKKWQKYIIIIIKFQRGVQRYLSSILSNIGKRLILLKCIKWIHNMEVVSVRPFVPVFIFETTDEFSWNSMLEVCTKYSAGRINIAAYLQNIGTITLKLGIHNFNSL